MGFDIAEDRLHEVIYQKSLGRVKHKLKNGEPTLIAKEIDRLMRTK
jgi:hypothetical protein